MVAHKVGVAIGTCSALLCWYIVRTCTPIESVNTASFTGKMTELGVAIGTCSIVLCWHIIRTGRLSATDNRGSAQAIMRF